MTNEEADEWVNLLGDLAFLLAGIAALASFLVACFTFCRWCLR